MCLQVLPDWLPERARDALRTPSLEQRAANQVATAAQIRVSLQDEAAARDKELARTAQAEIAKMGKERVANVSFLKALEIH